MDLPTKQQLHPSSSQPLQHQNHPHHHQPCQHTFLPQSHIAPLPPLYLTPTATFTIRPSTLTKLTRALTSLGTPHTHSPFLNHDIVKLRKELEAGMSRERRQAMQFYILGIRGPRKRAAAEVYLARYKGFVFGVDGRLGFGTEEGAYGESDGERVEYRVGSGLGDRGAEPDSGRAGRSLRHRVGGCGVM
ncbi:hypothetical protein ONS95_004109 [Cadophora gregata]|uniref:uncharacterized protein n=1 Tax=Cadophora gregata TaxID=51156 RepID=UPI0026DBF558|nr:uncharacterized protein ONS95_004109 [Cadophora gregata]KAK0105531.1 hypothetical protein ONS96_004917 [Cadophora gregata f. sp. sojae]KAK0105577.1 hypothetical protein ONS95_004109 [Cadophora gregata]